VNKGRDERPDKVISIRLYGPNELAGIQTCGYYESGNLSLLSRGKCQACACFSSVAIGPIRRSVVDRWPQPRLSMPHTRSLPNEQMIVSGVRLSVLHRNVTVAE
jgi:hypothetical protein